MYDESKAIPDEELDKVSAGYFVKKSNPVPPREVSPSPVHPIPVPPNPGGVQPC
jgi:hypothetical protein